MNVTRRLAMLALTAVLALGCGQSTPTSTGGGQSENAAKTPSSKIAADAKPEFVVSAFLEALRRGDKDDTALLLTDKARNETISKGLVVSPESVPNASYKVAAGEILPQNPNGAHVSSVWSEKFPDGSEEEYEIVWVLRKQPDGWRIAGMATQLAAGQEALFLNFEDPEDMLKKRDEATKQIETNAALTATAPTENKGGGIAQSPEQGSPTRPSSNQAPPNKLRR